ncbi:hypothetical protein KAJ27_07815 [bacterium]|nr:hypothetical protein [bacterium]
MDEIRFKTSKSKLLFLFIGCIVFVVTAFFMTSESESFERGVGWIGIIFFSLCGLKILFGMFNSSDVIVINMKGIQDCRTGIGLIRWKDITSVSVMIIGTNKFLSLGLRDEEKYLKHINSFKRILLNSNKNLGLNTISPPFVGLAPDIEKAAEFIAVKFPNLLI